jgi:hypothetical protein
LTNLPSEQGPELTLLNVDLLRDPLRRFAAERDWERFHSHGGGEPTDGVESAEGAAPPSPRSPAAAVTLR